MGRRQGIAVDLQSRSARCTPVDTKRENRRRQSTRAHGKTSRRILPLANEDDDTFRRECAMALGARRRRARVGGRMPRGWLTRRFVSLAVGPQQPNLWRLAEVQRSVLRSAHGVVDAI